MSGSNAQRASELSAASDGRLLRAERSRERMVRAMFELVGDENLEPTAQQVADRAGVGIRTVFRHFSDMETLFAEMNDLLIEEATPFLDLEPETGNPSQRALGFVRSRVKAFERFEPYLRATRMNRARSAFLQRGYSNMIRRQRAALREWVPELEGAPVDLVDAMEAATSFEQWDDLRATRGLSRARSRAAIEKLVCGLTVELD